MNRSVKEVLIVLLITFALLLMGAIFDPANAQTRNCWTITVTTAGGLTCLVASGQAYEELNEELLTEGAAL